MSEMGGASGVPNRILPVNKPMLAHVDGVCGCQKSDVPRPQAPIRRFRRDRGQSRGACCSNTAACRGVSHQSCRGLGNSWAVKSVHVLPVAQLRIMHRVIGAAPRLFCGSVPHHATYASWAGRRARPIRMRQAPGRAVEHRATTTVRQKRATYRRWRSVVVYDQHARFRGHGTQHAYASDARCIGRRTGAQYARPTRRATAAAA